MGKVREGLADVIRIHELLTNELLIWYLSHTLIGTQKTPRAGTLNVALCKAGKFILRPWRRYRLQQSEQRSSGPTELYS